MRRFKKSSLLQIAAVTVVLLTVTSLVNADNLRREFNRFQFELSDENILHIHHKHEGSPKELAITLGAQLPKELLNAVKKTDENDALNLEFGAGTRLKIIEPAPECIVNSWTTTELPELRDCIDYGNSQWFGGPTQWEQLWPVQKLVKENYAYYVKNADSMGVAERFWLSSNGVYLFVEPDIPLFIDSNATGDGQLCFTAKFDKPYIAVPELVLRYHVCTLPTPREAHLHALNSILNARPTQLPDELMIRYPVWSTWARYKTNISEAIVMQYATEINQQSFPNSQLEIDDDWETCYGELEFDLTKFPDPARLVTQLKDLGFRSTLWIHPFINSDCPSFDTVKNLGYFVSDADGNVIGSWWNSNSTGVIDFTNPEAKEWFIQRVRNIQNSTGFDSFKFDAGDTGNLPDPVYQGGDPRLQPNSYTTAYVEAVSEFGTMVETRVAASNQRVPFFIRMPDKDSRWGVDNGLRTLVTTMLVLTTSGYPYVLPDMIGGNGYGSDVVTPELFIRWLQASTFMPSLQFSYVPWDYADPQVTTISRQFVTMHADFADEILAAAGEAMSGGWPINAPIWYVDEQQSDEEAFAVDDEFLMGRTLLVAPVLDEGATSRDVYLPGGVWDDLTTGQRYVGPTWLRDYPAPLNVLPHFRLSLDDHLEL